MGVTPIFTKNIILQKNKTAIIQDLNPIIQDLNPRPINWRANFLNATLTESWSAQTNVNYTIYDPWLTTKNQPSYITNPASAATDALLFETLNLDINKLYKLTYVGKRSIFAPIVVVSFNNDIIMSYDFAGATAYNIIITKYFKPTLSRGNIKVYFSGTTTTYYDTMISKLTLQEVIS